MGNQNHRVAHPVKAVLLDSGGVLTGPIGGRWNPRSDFERNLLAHHPDLDDDAIAQAIAVGDAFLDSGDGHDYREYYRTILRELAVDPTEALLDALLPDRPATEFVEPYAEVVDVLLELRRRDIRMAVVSDAWPSLPDMHAAIGIPRGCIEVYAISAVLGCTKPDPRMYRHASDGLGLEPHECLFVDDVPDLVAAAVDLGYQAVMVRRFDEPVPPGMQAIDDLRGLLDLV